MWVLYRGRPTCFQEPHAPSPSLTLGYFPESGKGRFAIKHRFWFTTTRGAKARCDSANQKRAVDAKRPLPIWGDTARSAGEGGAVPEPRPATQESKRARGKNSRLRSAAVVVFRFIVGAEPLTVVQEPHLVGPIGLAHAPT